MKTTTTENEKNEIQKLKNELLQHNEIYGDIFKGVKKTIDEGITIADALLKDDYKTFKKYKLKYTKHTAEKMQGIDSLSTYKKFSSVCLANKKKGGICAHCYADKSINLYRAAIVPALIYNTLLLKYIDIDPSQILYINSKYFRFESFSDIQSPQHLKNLFAICRKNKDVIFTLWTKGADVLPSWIDSFGGKFPNNLNLIISESKINKLNDPAQLENIKNKLNIKNGVKGFAVFDDENKRRASGGYLCRRCCVDCLKCYKKSKNNILIAEEIH